MEALNAKGKSLKGAKVLVLGVAYKRDVNDIRESPSLKLVELLSEKGANVCYNDPYVAKIQVSRYSLTSIALTEKQLLSADCVVIATDHSCYDYKGIAKKAGLVFDTRGATRKLKNKNIVRL